MIEGAHDSRSETLSPREWPTLETQLRRAENLGITDRNGDEAGEMGLLVPRDRATTEHNGAQERGADRRREGTTK
jgi:hypothetical protein